MKKLLSATLLVVVALTSGCSSSSDTKTPSNTNGSSGTSGTPGSSGDPGTGTTGGETAPKAPSIDEVKKMMGALHVMWTNNEASCDSIEGERQAAMSDGSIMEKYKVTFTVPGDADNKMDGSATDDMKYTYRLRCKKGSTYSEYSNEASGNPVK